MLKRFGQKLLAVLMTLAMLISLLPTVTLTAAAAGTLPNAGNADGSSLWPYIVDEPSDLTWLSAQVDGGTTYDGKYFLQTADLNMSAVVGWTPIGSAARDFSGHYNGNGHTISGLSCTSSLDDVGLFGYVSSGSIQNLILSNFTIVNTAAASGNPKSTGTLAGSCYAAVTNCHVIGASSVTCDVAYTSTIGGLIGQGTTVLNNCSSSASVSSSYGYTTLGGVIGSNSASIENCLFNGSVTNSAGSAVNGAGGISGYITNASVKKSVSLGSITTNSPTKGGIVGNVYNSSNTVVYINAGDGNFFLTGTAVNGYGSYYSPLDSTLSNPSNTGATAKTEAELKVNATYSGWDFAGVWKNDTDGVTYPYLRKPACVTTSGVDTSNPASTVVSAVVNSDGGSDVTARGVEYIRSGDGAYTQVAAAGAGTGSYTVSLAALPQGIYTVRAYAVNSIATVYGETFEFLSSTAPTFVGGTTSFSVAQNSSATDVRSLLHASDTDIGQLLTWSEDTPPSHGSLSFSGAVTAASGSTDIKPGGGTITYTPAAGYTGSDTFAIQVSDGSASATRTITVSVYAPTPFYVGNALRYADADDSLSTGYLTDETNDITMESWVKADTFSGAGTYIRIMYNGDSSQTGYGIYLAGVNKSPRILIGAVMDAYTVTPVTLNTSQWYHLAAVRDNSVWTLYINGVAYNVTNNTSEPRSLAPLNTFTVGNSPVQNENFMGSIDEVRFWEVARTGQQIRENMYTKLQGGEVGLLAYYNFDQAGIIPSGDNTAINTVTDVAGGNQNLSISAGFARTGTTSNFVQSVNMGSFQIGSDAYTIGENGGSVSIPITRTGGSEGSATISYATANGTAAAGTNYTATSGSVTFAEGETDKNIVVPVTNQHMDGSKTFSFTISAPFGVTLGTNRNATVAITGTPKISVNDPSVAEGNGDPTALEFTVTLSAPSSAAITVEYATANGTAAAGSDYTAASGTLTFNPGDLSKTVSINVLGDVTDEADETVLMNLSNASGADIVDGQGVGTITDDDGAPTISVNDPAVLEGDAGPAALTFVVTLSAASGKTVTVDYATANGTATTADGDYAPSSGTLTYSAGETSKTISVTVNGDVIGEASQTVLLNLTTPSNATISDNQGVGTITNDDGAPTITSATYNAFTGTLTVTGTGLPQAAGADIDASKLTVTGEGGITYTLTDTPDVEITSAISFTVTLSAADRAAVNQIFNKNDTESTSGTTYNLAAADDWAAGAEAAEIADEVGNPITVSNVAVPTITSAVYDAVTGTLTANGTGFLALSGAYNDIDASKLTVTGEGGSTYALTDTADVELTSGSGFTLTLSPTDKVAMNQILSKNGTSSFGGTTYNLAATEDWIRGADAAVVVADQWGNGVTVSGITGIIGITLPTNGTYRTGDSLDFFVQFDAAVNVSYNDDASKPYIEINLNAGGPARAYYQSGSGSNTLVFRYTVTSGELDSDGFTLLSPINPNTGAIKNASDINASLYFTSPSTANIKVDGILPTVTSVSASTVNGIYNTGDTIAITVTFNENVTITGTPQLTLETGGTDRVVNYALGSGTNTLTFNYTVQAGDSASDLDYFDANALAFNSGTIRDAAGNIAVLTLPAPGQANSLGANKAIVIDTAAPAITAASCALSPVNTYLDVVFDEDVYGSADGVTALTAGRFALTFTQNGGTALNAVISSVSILPPTGNEMTVRVFLTITGTPNGLETIEIKPANAMSVYDKAGNAIPATQTTGVKALNDLAPTTLVNAVLTDTTHITVTLSENSVNITKANDGGFTVSETGAPGITYAVTSIAQGADASHVVLTVAEMGVSAKEGITVKYAAGGSGTVQDALGNAMTTNGTGVSIAAWDTTAPTISSGTLSSGNTYIDVVFDEGVYGAADGATALTASKLALTFTKNGGTASNAVISSVTKNDNTAESSASALIGGETTVRVFLTVTGTPNGLETIELNPADGASVFDKAGNATLAIQTTGAKLLNNLIPPPPPKDEGTNVQVNGQSYSAGNTEDTKNGNGQTVTTVTVDTDKLQKILDGQGQGAVVTIPISTGSSVSAGVLTGQMVDSMENNGATLVIETDTASYTLPAVEINIGAVAQLLGENVTLSDIVVTVSVSAPSDDMAAVIEDAASEGGFALVVPAVEFTVSCTYNNQTVDVTAFNAYVERTIRIPDGVDPAKITTAVIVDSDGTTRHVPTQITIIGGKYYAVVNSLTNSVYTVIWNPVEFTDAAGSWAKDAINSMGSRMVITGVGDHLFDPDRDITRAEFAAIVVRALGLPSGVGTNNFADVKDGVWYCPFIETAVTYGLITGSDDGLFHPEDAITREQAMTIIQRAMALTGLEQNLTAADIGALLQAFPDNKAVSGYAQAGVAACVKTGIVLGRSGLLAPSEAITRAEVAVIIQRLLEKSNLI